MAEEVLCPRCPMCDQPPGLVVSPLQAFCGNDDCAAFCWNMTWTRAKNMTEVNVIDLGGTRDGNW